MFGIPQSQPNGNGARYYVPLRVSHALGLRLTLTSPGVLSADLRDQPVFKSLQTRILSELVHHKQLFKTPPSLDSLVALSPPFGPVLSGKETLYSPTATFRHDPRSVTPSVVDLVLEGLYVSRSCISPVFSTRFIEKPAPAELEFADDGLEEIADLPDTGEHTQVVLLTDPAVVAKEKADKKQSVKEAFMLATAAKERAIEKAHAFLEEYDLSDNESGFSEFMDEEDEDEEDEEDEEDAADEHA
jgi:hypothetical protein